MTIYVGEIVVVKGVALSPVNGSPIVDATATVEFYDPTKNPRTVLTDRTPEVGLTRDLTYDEAALAYLGFVPTEGWLPGRWSYRVQLSSALYNTWEYGTFTLRP